MECLFICLFSVFTRFAPLTTLSPGSRVLFCAIVLLFVKRSPLLWIHLQPLLVVRQLRGMIEGGPNQNEPARPVSLRGVVHHLERVSLLSQRKRVRRNPFP